MRMFLLLAWIFCLSSEIVQSAEILAMIPNPFYSHQATFRPLWRELAKRGHKITLLTTDPMETNENITQIDNSKTYEIFEKYGIKKMMTEGVTLIQLMSKLIEVVDELYSSLLRHPDLIELMENKEKFDLMIVEMIEPVAPVLSRKFKCPYIGVTSMDALSPAHGAMGNLDHPAIYPFPQFEFEVELTFKERLISTTFNIANMLFFALCYLPFGDAYVKKYIGEDLPSVADVYRNASLLFINANPIFSPPRPIGPTTINLSGGLHITKPQRLPKDLQDYLDQSEHGCVYFSFGSTVNSGFLSPETIEIFRATFKELAPIRVLWKFENETLPNKPKNVLLKKWLPQQDVLRHPNVKAFITQGGLQSMEEAIHNAVPMLGIPFYGDQMTNVKKMVLKEFGVKLDIKTMTQKALKNSILELLNNPLYKKNIERLSAISKDQPMSGLEKAVWWTEYVLRHGGTEHLRSPSADIPLYQYLFLDIIAFMTFVVIFISMIFYYSIKLIFKIFRFMFSKKIKEKVT